MATIRGFRMAKRKFSGEVLPEESEVAKAAREGFGGSTPPSRKIIYEIYLDPAKVDKGLDGNRCPYFVKSYGSGTDEQCCLHKDHEGMHKWASGD